MNGKEKLTKTGQAESLQIGLSALLLLTNRYVHAAGRYVHEFNQDGFSLI